MFEAQWIVDDTMPDGGDFDPALVEYGTAQYKTLESAQKRAEAESAKSPMEWFVINEYEIGRLYWILAAGNYCCVRRHRPSYRLANILTPPNGD